MSATASPARAERRLRILSALFLGALASPAAAAPSRGAVVYVTATHAYLDHGDDASLQPGQALTLRRRGKAAARCTVEAVFERRALCAHQGARTGDGFDVPASKTGGVNAVTTLPPVPSDTQLARAQRTVSSAAVPPVRFRGVAASAVTAALAEVSLDHGSWAATSARTGPFHGERVDLSLRGMPLPWGLRLSADATAIGWARKPASSRHPLGRAQLFVRQLELARRGREPGLTFSAGRIWPSRAPGVGVIDGAQLGFADPRAGWEAGILAGTRPGAISTEPSLAHPLFGVYAAHTLSSDGLLQRTHEQARVTVEPVTGGLRTEAELDARAWLGRFADVGADVRAVFAPGVSFPIELATLDAQLRPWTGWRLAAGARYTGPTDLVLPRDVLERAWAGHADALVAWDGLDWLGLGVGATASQELSSGLSRAEVGPELKLPRLFGDRGGISGAYRYGVGWLGGHSGHLQTVVAPVPAVRVLARASYFSARSPSPSLPSPELGLFVSAEYAATRWLRLRGSAWGQLPLDVVGWPDEGDGPRYATLVATAGVAATF